MILKRMIKKMKQYNLSQIMKDAHSLRRNSPEKFSTFSQALKASWSMAKFRKQIEANRAETIAYHEAKKREAQVAARTARIDAERAERLAKLKEQKYASVEAECVAYGYGRGNRYSAWSGWGNYCGD